MCDTTIKRPLGGPSMAGTMAVEGPAADPMAADDQPYVAGGESARHQELLAKVAALEEKAADDAKTIADIKAEKEAAAKTIVERDETIKTLTAANEALTADNASLKEDKAELRATNTILLANNTAIAANNTTFANNNTAIATNNTAITTANTAIATNNTTLADANIRSSNMAQYFKKAYLREKHMRHKSDGRHGAACGKRVIKLQEANKLMKEQFKKDMDECIEELIEKQGEVYYVKGEMNEKEQNFEKSRKRYRTRLNDTEEQLDELKQKYNDSSNEIARMKASRRGDPARTAAMVTTLLAYVRAVVNGTEPYEEYFTLSSLVEKIAVFAKDAVKPENPTQMGVALRVLKFTTDASGIVRLPNVRTRPANCRAFDVPRLRVHLQQFATM